MDEQAASEDAGWRGIKAAADQPQQGGCCPACVSMADNVYLFYGSMTKVSY